MNKPLQKNTYAFTASHCCGMGLETWTNRHMETLCALLALCEENPSVTSGFSSQRTKKRGASVLPVSLDKLSNKQSRCRWLKTSSPTPTEGWKTDIGNTCQNKQRVLMHRHQGWNVRHGLCHIYMRYIYIYIWVVYSFCLFCCLFIIVTWWYIWCIVWQVASKRKYRHVW